MANPVDVGPTGWLVAANVKSFRQAAGLSLRDLERLLQQAGRPIQLTGLHRLENGKRRVDVDELAAIALVLGVTPARLLAERASDDRLATDQVEKHRAALDVATESVEAAVSAGLPLRAVLDHVEITLVLAALKGRPDMQGMYLRAYEAGDKIPHLPLALQSEATRAEYAQRHRERVDRLAAAVEAGTPGVSYDADRNVYTVKGGTGWSFDPDDGDQEGKREQA